MSKKKLFRWFCCKPTLKFYYSLPGSVNLQGGQFKDPYLVGTLKKKNYFLLQYRLHRVKCTILSVELDEFQNICSTLERSLRDMPHPPTSGITSHPNSHKGDHSSDFYSGKDILQDKRMVTQSLSDSGRRGRDVSLKFTTLLTGKQLVDGQKTSFPVQILMLVNFIRKMVKYFTGNVNSQKEVQAVRFGLRPGLG